MGGGVGGSHSIVSVESASVGGIKSSECLPAVDPSIPLKNIKQFITINHKTYQARKIILSNVSRELSKDNKYEEENNVDNNATKKGVQDEEKRWRMQLIQTRKKKMRI